MVCKFYIGIQVGLFSEQFISTITNYGPVHTYPFLFESGLFFPSGLSFLPHVSGEHGHPKRIGSKTLSRAEAFDHAGFSFTCGQTKKEFFLTR